MPRSTPALQGGASPAGAPSLPHRPSWSGSGAVLSACVVAVAVLLLLLFYYYAWRVFCPAGGSSGDAPPPPPLPRADGSKVMSPAVLDSLPTFVYAAAAGHEGVECSVCLTELVEGEVGRRLPRCDHRFHAECIDRWLRSHASCPLCRSTVELEAKFRTN